jgi:hypothetical protein
MRSKPGQSAEAARTLFLGGGKGIMAKEEVRSMRVDNQKTKGLIDALDAAGWTVDSFCAERIKLCAPNTEEATGYFVLKVFEKEDVKES